MEKIIEVGSITFFVADSMYDYKLLSEEDAENLAEELEKKVHDQFSKSPAYDFFTIKSVDWRRGCFIETFTLGLKTGAIWLAYKGVKEFLIDYPKIKAGLIQIFKDARDSVSWLRSKAKKSIHYVGISKIEISTGDEIKKALENSVDQEKK